MMFERRHAPDVWEDLVFADPATEDDLRQYAESRIFDNILLYGPYGSAKSTTAKVLAASSYGRRLSDANLDVTNLSHDIDSVLAAFSEGMRHGHTCMMNCTNHPYAIMDEVDKFSERQQLKLRAIIDEQVNGRFIFTTNNIEKVNPGLVDRCDCHELAVPPPHAILARAQTICRVEGISIADTELMNMITDVGGSLRRTIRGLKKFVAQSSQ